MPLTDEERERLLALAEQEERDRLLALGEQERQREEEEAAIRARLERVFQNIISTGEMIGPAPPGPDAPPVMPPAIQTPLAGATLGSEALYGRMGSAAEQAAGFAEGFLGSHPFLDKYRTAIAGGLDETADLLNAISAGQAQLREEQAPQVYEGIIGKAVQSGAQFPSDYLSVIAPGGALGKMLGGGIRGTALGFGMTEYVNALAEGVSQQEAVDRAIGAATVGSMYTGAHPLPQGERIVTMGAAGFGIGAGQAAMEGAPSEEIVEAGASEGVTMGLFGAMGPRGGISLAGRSAFRRALAEGKTAEEASKIGKRAQDTVARIEELGGEPPQTRAEKKQDKAVQDLRKAQEKSRLEAERRAEAAQKEMEASRQKAVEQQQELATERRNVEIVNSMAQNVVARVEVQDQIRNSGMSQKERRSLNQALVRVTKGTAIKADFDDLRKAMEEGVINPEQVAQKASSDMRVVANMQAAEAAQKAQEEFAKQQQQQQQRQQEGKPQFEVPEPDPADVATKRILETVNAPREQQEAVLKDLARELEMSMRTSQEIAEAPEPEAVPIADVQAVPTGKAPKLGSALHEESFQLGRKGTQAKTTQERFQNWLEDFKIKFGTEIQDLPTTPEYAEIRNEWLKWRKQGVYAQDRVVREMGRVLEALQDANDLELFEKKLWADDAFREMVGGREVAYTDAAEQFLADKFNIDFEVSANPRVQQAVAMSRDLSQWIRDAFVKEMTDAGFNVEGRLNKQDYFPHQVLEYARLTSGKGIREGVPDVMARPHMRHRKGSQKAYNVNYAQVYYKVLTQMMKDTQVAKMWQAANKMDKTPELKAKYGKEWKKHIPEDYVELQPQPGRVMFLTDSVAANVAREIHADALSELMFGEKAKGVTVTEADLKKVLALGRPRRTIIVPRHLANAIERTKPKDPPGMFMRGMYGMVRPWKIATLVGPWKAAKYNIRNLTGDAEALAIGNPRAFLKVPRAAEELLRASRGERSPEFEEWAKRGGIESAEVAQEIGEVIKSSPMRKLASIRGDNTTVIDGVKQVIKSAWFGPAKKATQLRESLLRYANYLDYLEQIQRSEGRPDNYGASDRRFIDKLPDWRDKAWHLSNDGLGAYDRISVQGQWARDHLMPFYSWKEVNTKRYINFWRNAVIDGKMAEQMGRQVLTKGATVPTAVAAKVGWFAIKASALWSISQAYNETFFPELEARLDENVRRKAHVILGQNEDGTTRYFPGIGTLGDFTDMFGVDVPIRYINDFVKGRKSIGEIGEEWARHEASLIANMISPTFKAPFEIAWAYNSFPDITRPRRFRDRGEHFARMWGADWPYRALQGIPQRKHGVQNLFWYTSELLEPNYWVTVRKRDEFLKKVKGTDYLHGTDLSDKADALYHHKRALRFRQDKLAKEQKAKYIELGGTEEGLASSYRNMHPDFGLGELEGAFIEWLSPEERQQREDALVWYKEVIGLEYAPEKKKEEWEKKRTGRRSRKRFKGY